MSNWAYFNRGRIHQMDIWDWNVPHDFLDSPAHKSGGSFFDVAREHVHNRNPAQHFIGFDGERWRFAHCGLPNSYLDAVKYPEDIHSYELSSSGGKGRRLHWMHGYTSQDASFPGHIPKLEKATLAQLHETHVIPHWMETDYQKIRDTRPIMHSQYGHIRDIPHIELREYLPPDALEALKKAHTEGKPILIAYDETAKTFANLTEPYERSLRQREFAPSPVPPSHSAASASSPRSSSGTYTSATASETRETEGFLKKLLSFRNANGTTHWGKVGGVAAGAAAIGGVAYLALGHKKTEEKAEPWASRVTKNNQVTMLKR